MSIGDVIKAVRDGEKSEKLMDSTIKLTKESNKLNMHDAGNAARDFEKKMFPNGLKCPKCGNKNASLSVYWGGGEYQFFGFCVLCLHGKRRSWEVTKAKKKR